jgi:site-specific recombinase XerD
MMSGAGCQIEEQQHAGDPPRCAGNTFEGRRDTALLMLLLDTGVRRAEMVGVKLVDVDLELDVLLVLGKGRRERTLPFGRRAGQALDRYLRAVSPRSVLSTFRAQGVWWRGSGLRVRRSGRCGSWRPLPS